MKYFNFTFLNCTNLKKVSAYFTNWPPSAGNYSNMASEVIGTDTDGNPIYSPFKATLYLLSSSTYPAAKIADKPSDFLNGWTILSTKVL